MNDVDIVAAGREAASRIVCYDALSMQWNCRRDSDIVSELCDKVERLQAELEKERRLHGMARSTISSHTAEVDRLRAEVADITENRNHWIRVSIGVEGIIA